MAKQAPTGTLSINEGEGPFHYGDTLTFTYEASKVGGGWPMVEVTLFQDVNEDEVVEEDLFSADLAWVTLNHPEQSVVLGAGAGSPDIALDVSKPAKGKARLLLYGWKGKQEFIIPLAQTGFYVEP